MDKIVSASRVRDAEGKMVLNQEEIRSRWKECFEELLVSSDSKGAKITCSGILRDRGRLMKQKNIMRKEIKNTVSKLTARKGTRNG